jgi:hypothetical protein
MEYIGIGIVIAGPMSIPWTQKVELFFALHNWMQGELLLRC